MFVGLGLPGAPGSSLLAWQSGWGQRGSDDLRAGGWRGEGCVHGGKLPVARPCALISRALPSRKAAHSRLLPRLRLWPGQCSAGLDSAWRQPLLRLSPSGDMDPSRAIQQEISSLKGAGQGGGGRDRGHGVCGPSCMTSAWMQSPQSSGRVCSSGGSPRVGAGAQGPGP